MSFSSTPSRTLSWIKTFFHPPLKRTSTEISTVGQQLAQRGQRLHWNPQDRHVQIVPCLFIWRRKPWR